MNLVKSKAKEDWLDEIVDENNLDFVDNDTREEFICTSFETLYKPPNNEQLEPNSVETFLGDTALHPIVANAKLSQRDKDMLEKNLTIEELDESIKRFFLTNLSLPFGIFLDPHFSKLLMNALLPVTLLRAFAMQI